MENTKQRGASKHGPKTVHIKTGRKKKNLGSREITAWQTSVKMEWLYEERR